MTDILERLGKLKLPTPLMKEAKAEIERLRNTLKLHAGDTISLSNEIDHLREEAEVEEGRLRDEIERLREQLAALNLCEPGFLDRKLRELDEAKAEIERLRTMLEWMENLDPQLVEDAREKFK